MASPTKERRIGAREKKLVYEGFLASILFKGIVSLNETVSGIALLFIPPAWFLSFTLWVAQFIPTSTFIGAHLAAQLQSYTLGTSHFLAWRLWRDSCSTSSIKSPRAVQFWSSAFPCSMSLSCILCGRNTALSARGSRTERAEGGAALARGIGTI